MSSFTSISDTEVFSDTETLSVTEAFPDTEDLLQALIDDYDSKINHRFINDVENFMKPCLMDFMQLRNMKPRGNISRFVVAVLLILQVSDFQLRIPTDHRIKLFPDYFFQPSDLCYICDHLKLDGPITIKFSFDEENSDLVTVSAMIPHYPDIEDEFVRSTVFDLMKYATPLIECLHGGVSNSSKLKIIELWSRVYEEISYPLLKDLRYFQLLKSDELVEYLLARDRFVRFAFDQNNSS